METIVREEIGVAPVELPPVVADWDELVEKAEKMTKTIDSHLDYESAYQGKEMAPQELCLDQRTELTSDLVACQ